MRALLSGLREKHSLIRDDANGMSIEMPEPGQQRRPVSLLKLVEATAVEDSRQHCSHIDVAFVIHRNDPV